jgi:STE24 endopeptidase
MSPALRTFLVGILAAFLLLFLVSTFLPPPASEYERAAQYFSTSEIETGLRYAAERRWLFWAGTGLELALMLTLVFTGAARPLADFYGRAVGYRPGPSDGSGAAPSRPGFVHRVVGFTRWLAVVLLVGATYLLLHEILQFPVSVARFYHSRAWGMTERPFLDWLNEYVLAVGVAAVGAAITGVGLYVLLRWFPRTWYLLGTAGATGLAFLVAYVMPVLIAPLFNTFTPLSQTEWAPLEPRLRALAERAGIPVEGIYVKDASRQGSHTNAYFNGLGSTQSIVLYDTLLSKHPPEEVESILAHEIGHWKHHHIINGILLGSLAALAGLIVLDRVLRWFVGRPPLRLRGLDDPAGVPLVVLLIFLGTWAALPLENAVSRHFERQADATSLQLAGMPDVFIAAERRLALDNHSNVVPAPWNVWLFSTHPTALERIEMARKWKESRGP